MDQQHLQHTAYVADAATTDFGLARARRATVAHIENAEQFTPLIPMDAVEPSSSTSQPGQHHVHFQQQHEGHQQQQQQQPQQHQRQSRPTPSQGGFPGASGATPRGRPGTVPANLASLIRSPADEHESIPLSEHRIRLQRSTSPDMTLPRVISLMRRHDVVITCAQLILPTISSLATFLCLRASGSTLGPFPLLFATAQSACGILVAGCVGRRQGLWTSPSRRDPSLAPFSEEESSAGGSDEESRDFPHTTARRWLASFKHGTLARVHVQGVLLGLTNVGFCHALAASDFVPLAISRIASMAVIVLTMTWLVSAVLSAPFLGYYSLSTELTVHPFAASLGGLISMLALRCRQDASPPRETSRPLAMLESVIATIVCAFVYALIEHARYDQEWALDAHLGGIALAALFGAVVAHLLPTPPPEVPGIAPPMTRSSKPYAPLDGGTRRPQTTIEAHIAQLGLVRAFLLHTVRDSSLLGLGPVLARAMPLPGRVIALYCTLVLQAGYFAYAYLWTPARKAFGRAIATKAIVRDVQMLWRPRDWAKILIVAGVLLCASAWGLTLHSGAIAGATDRIHIVLLPMSTPPNAPVPALIPRSSGRYLAPTSKSLPGLQSRLAVISQQDAQEWMKVSVHVGAHVPLYSRRDALPRTLALFKLWAQPSNPDRPTTTLLFPKVPADNRTQVVVQAARAQLPTDVATVVEMPHAHGALSWRRVLLHLYAPEGVTTPARVPWYLLIPSDSAVPVPRVLEWALRRATRDALVVPYYWGANRTGVHLMSAALIQRMLDDPVCAPDNPQLESTIPRARRWSGWQARADAAPAIAPISAQDDLHGSWIEQCASLLGARPPLTPRGASLVVPTMREDEGSDESDEHAATAMASAASLAELQRARPLVLRVPAGARLGTSAAPLVPVSAAPADAEADDDDDENSDSVHGLPLPVGERARRAHRAAQRRQLAGAARVLVALAAADAHPTLSWRAPSRQLGSGAAADEPAVAAAAGDVPDWPPTYWTLDVVHALAARVHPGPPSPVRDPVLRRSSPHSARTGFAASSDSGGTFRIGRVRLAHKPHSHAVGEQEHSHEHDEAAGGSLTTARGPQYWIVNATQRAVVYTSAAGTALPRTPRWLLVTCPMGFASRGLSASGLCLP